MGRRSLINRRAAKAADSMWRRSGMFSSGYTRPETQPPKMPPVSADTKNTGDCPDYIPEKDNSYPLCDNPACPEKRECNLSAHMIEHFDEK